VAVGAFCQLCWNAKNQTIINCTHNWFSISDPSLAGVACDMGLPSHVVAHASKAIVWSCSVCHAMACSGCHVG
jgi:hypothetical protein